MNIRHPITPESTRLFCGYKSDNLTQNEFFAELSHTFMPGTPYMQAPLGLNAYIPAVLDISTMESAVERKLRLPDEVALLAYSSLKDYKYHREHSLRRRIYTKAHFPVFNMFAPGGGGQFPSDFDAPSVRDNRISWHLNDNATDWMHGITKLYFLIEKRDARTNIKNTMLSVYPTLKADFEGISRIDQALFLSTEKYCCVWVHGEKEFEINSLLSANLPSDIFIARALTAVNIPLIDMENGSEFEIEGASMFNFLFKRDVKYFPKYSGFQA